MNKRWNENTLLEVTGKKQRAAQVKWFEKNFGVDPPKDALGVIMNDSTYDALLKKRYGLVYQDSSATSKKKPNLRLNST